MNYLPIDYECIAANKVKKNIRDCARKEAEFYAQQQKPSVLDQILRELSGKIPPTTDNLIDFAVPLQSRQAIALMDRVMMDRGTEPMDRGMMDRGTEPMSPQTQRPMSADMAQNIIRMSPLLQDGSNVFFEEEEEEEEDIDAFLDNIPGSSTETREQKLERSRQFQDTEPMMTPIEQFEFENRDLLAEIRRKAPKKSEREKAARAEEKAAREEKKAKKEQEQFRSDFFASFRTDTARATAEKKKEKAEGVAKRKAIAEKKKEKADDLAKRETASEIGAAKIEKLLDKRKAKIGKEIQKIKEEQDELDINIENIREAAEKEGEKSQKVVDKEAATKKKARDAAAKKLEKARAKLIKDVEKKAREEDDRLVAERKKKRQTETNISLGNIFD